MNGRPSFSPARPSAIAATSRTSKVSRRGLASAVPFLGLFALVACAGGSGSSLPLFGDDGGGIDSGTPNPEEDSGTIDEPDAEPPTDAAIPPDAAPSGGALGPDGSGRGTYYAATGAGNCSFPATPNDLMVAAVNPTEYAGSAVCGSCLEVTGPNGKVVVRAVDQCPECPKGALDLSKEAFAKLSPLSAGIIAITWHPVACPVTGPIRYQLKSGSSQYYTSIQVRNHRLPITKLELEVNGAFVNVPRRDYNYFELASGVKTAGAFRVRVTALGGNVLTDTLPAATTTSEIAGLTNF